MTSRGLPSSNKQTLALSVEIGDSKRREAFSPPPLFTLLYLQYLGGLGSILALYLQEVFHCSDRVLERSTCTRVLDTIRSKS